MQLYCFEVLHEHLLEILITYLDECLVNIQRDPTQWTQLGWFFKEKFWASFNWFAFLSFTEACIYAIYSIAEHIETDERTGLPKFIIILSEIPYDKLHEKLLGTALDSIGIYSIDLKRLTGAYSLFNLQVLIVNGSRTIQPIFRMPFVLLLLDWIPIKRHRRHSPWKICAVNVKCIWNRMPRHCFKHVCKR